MTATPGMLRLAPIALLPLLLLAACSEDASRCPAGGPVSEGCACSEELSCKKDLVCDGDTSRCREALACEDLVCGEHQSCEEGSDGGDSLCAESCDPGWIWDVLDKACEAAPPTCEAGEPTSIATDCEEQHRDCLDYGDGARCGTCVAGYAQGDESCEPLATCADLTCAAVGRACDDATETAAATCGDCLGGWVEDAGECFEPSCGRAPSPGNLRTECEARLRVCEDGDDGAGCGKCWPGHVEDVEDPTRCRPVRTCTNLDCWREHRVCLEPAGDESEAACGDCVAGYDEVDGGCRLNRLATCKPGPDSIAAACDGESRVCVEDEEGAQCGGCIGDLVEHPNTRVCMEPVTCAEAGLDCESRGLICAEEPSAHCGGCKEGLVWDAEIGSCRSPLACDEVSCPEGWTCVAGAPGQDAACGSDCDPHQQLWNGRRCVPCPPCDRSGEAGRWPVPTDAGYCICETEPGWFFSMGGDIGTFPCDADGDGWVRESARVALDSGDAALMANARCAVRDIDRFVLENEAGRRRVEHLARPLSLYESVRNDDDALLRAMWETAGLPDEIWGDDGEHLSARAFNRLTKVCHARRTDYNDNGVPDVEEWGDRDRTTAVRAEQRPFNRFSFFLELHEGWYEGGAYHIREKARVPEAGAEGVPIEIADAGGADHWRRCSVRQDSAWESTIPPVGMDLAAYFEPPAAPEDPFVLPPPPGPGPDFFSGMNHHSLFKCVVLSESEDEMNPLALTPSAAVAQLALSRCSAEVPEEEGGAGANPAHPSFTCEPVADADARPGQVRWGVVDFVPYRTAPADYVQGAHYGCEAFSADFVDPAAYVRGCVDECEWPLVTEACFSSVFQPDDNRCAVGCRSHQDNYGLMDACMAWEVCDGLDNDYDYEAGTFDGDVDEDLPAVGTACSTGDFGVCGPGIWACVPGGGAAALECQADQGSSPEVCDGLDNDCDGETDERFPDGIVVTFLADETDLKFTTLSVEAYDAAGQIGSLGPYTGDEADTLVLPLPFNYLRFSVARDDSGRDDYDWSYGVEISWTKADGTTGRRVVKASKPASESATENLPLHVKEESVPDDIGSNLACSNAPGLKGVCKKGYLHCRSTGEGQAPALVCDSKVLEPGTEICADSKDNDCDGETDENVLTNQEIAQGVGPVGCSFFYKDEDNDGWGAVLDKRCLCSADGDYKVNERRLPGEYDEANNVQLEGKVAWDCCDTDDQAYPGQTSYSAYSNDCALYDFNCDGVETKKWTTIKKGGCYYHASVQCRGGTTGWVSGEVMSPPDCGTSASYYTGSCKMGFLSCSSKSETRRQKCR